MSRVAVTGSSGLIGSALVARLRQRGDDVVRFVRPQSAQLDGTSVVWEPERGRVDIAALDALGPIDSVVHLAGAGIADHRWSDARKREIRDSRTLSTATLVRALGELSTRPSVLVSGSAIGIYGSRGADVLDEQTAPGTGFLADVCREWETSAAPLQSSETAVALLRTGIVLCRHGGALKKQLPLFRAGLGGRLGSGEQWMSPIVLSDLIDVIEFIIEQRLAGPVNAVLPQPVTNAEFTNSLARALHRPGFAAVPTAALRLALGAELVDEAIVASQRVIPQVLLDAGFEFAAPNVNAAIAAALGS